MNFKQMLVMSAMTAATLAQPVDAQNAPFIGRQRADQVAQTVKNGRLTPEALWGMGRIGGFALNQQGNMGVYSVTYYSIKQNKSHSVLYSYDMNTQESKCLTTSTKSEGGGVFIKGGSKIAFLSSESGSSQVWEMNPDGTDRRQLSHEPDDVLEFLFSPDEAQVILIKEVESTTSIQKNDADLPQATGIVCNDLMYKHWDQYVRAIPHPFVAAFDGNKISGTFDILKDEPYECPMLPFGGVEQLAWSPDGRQVAYTCRKKTGRDYAISTDSDIYLYDIQSGQTRNLCKPADYKEPEKNATVSLAQQSVNQQEGDCNVGYDQNPQFSPNGRYIAWTSMERDGYESDRTRLCVLNLKTGSKTYVTESFESGVNEFCWTPDSKGFYFTGVWHGRTHVYTTNLKGEVNQLTHGDYDYSLLQALPFGRGVLAKRHSMSTADEVFTLVPEGKGLRIRQLTEENKAFYDQITMGEVKERWVKTSDGKDMLCWVIYPPHFDAKKKYPALLFCEGGPQSPVSQFWSYRWNFQVMAANDYIIIAPNRRGLPGFGMEWLEEISGDYSGQCMQDYLSAIDDLCREPYVDKDHLGAVGASFGGYSVYWLAGNHDKRFKAFIAHDGIYNTQQQYVETEELWFPNWDMGSAPWEKTANEQMQKAFATSPHLYVDRWDTPILCIHGQRDFRIEYTQAESAFTAARMRGLDAQLLLFPDENHWVLKPQNGILWQRTFFRWLDKYLKH